MKKFKKILLSSLLLAVPIVALVSCENTETKDSASNEASISTNGSTNAQTGTDATGTNPSGGNTGGNTGGDTSRPAAPLSLISDGKNLLKDEVPYEIANPYGQKFVKRYLGQEKDYLPALSRQLFTPESFVSDLVPFDQASIDKFNASASTALTPYFASSIMKNFSLPSKDGKLVLNPIKVQLKNYSALDHPTSESVRRDFGLPRLIPNQHYKNILLQSFAIQIYILQQEALKSIGDKGIVDKIELGTAWILDYALDGNGYPTKWYIATNLHVATAFRKPYVKGSKDPYIHESTITDDVKRKLKELYDYTSHLENEYKRVEGEMKAEETRNGQTAEYLKLKKELERINNDEQYGHKKQEYKNILDSMQGYTKNVTFYHFSTDTGINSKLDVNRDEVKVNRFVFKPEQIRIVYAGTDFTKQSPSDYVYNDEFKNLQEMADFAVLELDLSQPNEDNTYKVHYRTVNKTDEESTFNNAQDLARSLTSNYANDDKLKSKPANFDVYQKYFEWSEQKIPVGVTNSFANRRTVDRPLIDYNFLALGFPNSYNDIEVRDSKPTEGEKDGLKATQSVWVNRPFLNYGANWDQGYKLSNNLGFETFVDKPGVTDMTISTPIINSQGNAPFSINGFKEVDAPYQNDKYINYGLGYYLASWQPFQGASGSSLRTLDKKIIGINFLAGDSRGVSKTAVSQALRSNGINYNGHYGAYNLAQYDLVYGGGENQRTSYREKLQQIYGDNYRTYLFEQGTNVIPDEYKFKP
ncbi:Ig-specific serine endopeptidase MIP [Mycoplasma corogypsi]|uniref:Ig-specific serine endopeptidase MIP n=1 Tax=Mycoplasma corogypsi TaxID=2106 RepID=UPI0038731ADC